MEYNPRVWTVDRGETSVRFEMSTRVREWRSDRSLTSVISSNPERCTECRDDSKLRLGERLVP